MDLPENLLTNDDPSRIFGDPYEAGAVTIVPVARIRRGRNGGPPSTQALGIYAVRGDEVTWHPAIDQNRIALIGVITGLLAAVLGTVAMIRRPPWPDLRGTIK